MSEETQILMDAANEIQQLREQNRILKAKVEVMDLFACVLHTQPAYNPQSYSVDVRSKLLALITEKELPKQALPKEE